MDMDSSPEEPLLENDDFSIEQVEAVQDEVDAVGDNTTNYFCWGSPRIAEMVVCLIFYIATCATFSYGPFAPHQRPIPFQLLESGDYARNMANNETREGDTISASILVFIALLLQLALSLLRKTLGGHKSFDDLHATFCVYMLASTINRIATESVKNYAGYLRPIFYEECQPDDTYSRCTADDEGGASIRKSFPSGHASMSFCGLTLLTLYIHTKFGMGNEKKKQETKRIASLVDAANRNTSSSEIVYHENVDRTSLRWKYFTARIISTLGLLPMGFALYISAQRVVYNMHFPADIVGGAVLGASISLFVHGLYF